MPIYAIQVAICVVIHFQDIKMNLKTRKVERTSLICLSRIVTSGSREDAQNLLSVSIMFPKSGTTLIYIFKRYSTLDSMQAVESNKYSLYMSVGKEIA